MGRSIVGCLMAVSLLVGCGELTKQSGADIVADARSDMAELRAMHIRLDASMSGRPESRDLVLTRPGGCQGTISVSGSSIKIIRLNDRTYVKPDESYWPLILGGDDGPLVSTVGGRWILFTAPEDQMTFDRFCDFDNALDSVLDQEAWQFEASGAAEPPGADGVPVVSVDGRIEDRLDLQLLIRAEEPYYVEKLVMSGESRTRIDFFEFDAEPGFTEPNVGESIRIEDLR